jgi:hypothetical protein
MLVNIGLGCLLVVLTTMVHAGFMMGVFNVLKFERVKRRSADSGWVQVYIVSMLVVGMLIASLVEAAMWAATYLWLGAIGNFHDAMYFSTVTYTTLGYGDLTLDEGRRLLSAIQAANGIIMFGWTTAIIVAGVTRVYFPGAQVKNDV